MPFCMEGCPCRRALSSSVIVRRCFNSSWFISKNLLKVLGGGQLAVSGAVEGYVSGFFNLSDKGYGDTDRTGESSVPLPWTDSVYSLLKEEFSVITAEDGVFMGKFVSGKARLWKMGNCGEMEGYAEPEFKEQERR